MANHFQSINPGYQLFNEWIFIKKNELCPLNQLALNRARGNITDQVARYNRINLFYKQFQASVRISYKNVP